MNTRHVPRSQWSDFLKSFGREHATWEVTIEVERPTAVRKRVLDGLPLLEICVDDHGSAGSAIAIWVARGESGEVRHVIAEPRSVLFTELCSGPAALQIDSPDARTRIYVRPFVAPLKHDAPGDRPWRRRSRCEAGDEAPAALGAPLAN